jgi:hypothetical protein
MIHHRRDERGAALVETALVLGLLLMLAIGALEFGLAFRDWLSVSSATREGARVAASAGPTTDADCAILEATAGSLLSIDGSRIRFVDIFRADPAGNPVGSFQTYRPFDSSTDHTDNLRCTSWFAVNETGYPPASRDNRGAARDWIGVRLGFQHSWKTGFFWWSGSVNWSDRTIILMEPAPDPG